MTMNRPSSRLTTQARILPGRRPRRAGQDSRGRSWCPGRKQDADIGAGRSRLRAYGGGKAATGCNRQRARRARAGRETKTKALIMAASVAVRSSVALGIVPQLHKNLRLAGAQIRARKRPRSRHREEIVMRAIAILMFALVGLCSINSTVRAEQSTNCTKQCRDQQRACNSNYAGKTCKSEYEICIKSCRQK